MKVRSSFVTNSSSTSYIITNMTDEDLTFHDFLRDFSVIFADIILESNGQGKSLHFSECFSLKEDRREYLTILLFFNIIISSYRCEYYGSWDSEVSLEETIYAKSGIEVRIGSDGIDCFIGNYTDAFFPDRPLYSSRFSMITNRGSL